MRMRPDRLLGDGTIIAASGNPLGDRIVRREIRRGTLQLDPGDLFVAFTDGVVERQATSGKLFGDRRLRSLFVGRPLPADPAALAGLRDEVRDAIERFAAGTVAQDDITFVLCQYDPPAASGRQRAEAS